jgi:hypothetical protein
MKSGLRFLVLFLLAVCVALPATAASKRKQARLLEQTQAAYATAVRWSEFEQAWGAVDPAYRQAHPLTGLDLERYRQVQVTGYASHDDPPAADSTVSRSVELRVVNRHTMTERVLRLREHWRWDEAAQRWWLLDGLPDLWGGE